MDDVPLLSTLLTYIVSLEVTPLPRVCLESSPKTDRQHGAIGVVADALSRGVKHAHLDLSQFEERCHDGV